MWDAPRIVAADMPDRGRMHYLVNDDLDFIPEVKAFLDWKIAVRRAPASIQAYCYRLSWYYRFLHQRDIPALAAKPEDLTEFVIWLCHPLRDTVEGASVDTASAVTARPLTVATVNQILQAVQALYAFLVRRGELATSPVLYERVARSAWLVEQDLLAHTRRGGTAQTVSRMALKLKEPRRQVSTVSDADFQIFIDRIAQVRRPEADPSGFRDRLLCLMLKEGGFRIGELLGMHVEDLDFGAHGVHVRFRTNNANGARAKAGYGRDRFVQLPSVVLGMIDVYLTDVWANSSAHTPQFWLVLKRNAYKRTGESAYGTALTRDAVEQMFRHYTHASGVRIHPHLLRHTHASDLVRSYLRTGADVDWKFIQERLGHASVVTTMQIYTHLSREDTALAYERYMRKREQTHATEQQPSSSAPTACEGSGHGAIH